MTLRVPRTDCEQHATSFGRRTMNPTRDFSSTPTHTEQGVTQNHDEFGISLSSRSMTNTKQAGEPVSARPLTAIDFIFAKGTTHRLQRGRWTITTSSCDAVTSHSPTTNLAAAKLHMVRHAQSPKLEHRNTSSRGRERPDPQLEVGIKWDMTLNCGIGSPESVTPADWESCGSPCMPCSAAESRRPETESRC